MPTRYRVQLSLARAPAPSGRVPLVRWPGETNLRRNAPYLPTLFRQVSRRWTCPARLLAVLSVARRTPLRSCQTSRCRLHIALAKRFQAGLHAYEIERAQANARLRPLHQRAFSCMRPSLHFRSFSATVQLPITSLARGKPFTIRSWPHFADLSRRLVAELGANRHSSLSVIARTACRCERARLSASTAFRSGRFLPYSKAGKRWASGGDRKPLR